MNPQGERKKASKKASKEEQAKPPPREKTPRDYEKNPLTKEEKKRYDRLGDPYPTNARPAPRGSKSPKAAPKVPSRSPPKPIANPFAGLGFGFANLGDIFKQADKAAEQKKEKRGDDNEPIYVKRKAASPIRDALKEAAANPLAVSLKKQERENYNREFKALEDAMIERLGELKRRPNPTAEDRKLYKQIKDQFYEDEYQLKKRYPTLYEGNIKKGVRLSSKSRSRSKSR